jgi:hypothetical protein
MRLRVLKYGAAAAAITLIIFGPTAPAYAVNNLKVYQDYNYQGSGCCGYDYPCYQNTYYVNLVAPIKSLRNNCSFRVWFRQNRSGSPGYNHCYSPGQAVSHNSSTYWYPNYIYIGTSSAACPL